MGIELELSTSLGVRGNEPNKLVTEKCKKNPKLLNELIPVLNSKNKGLSADAAEVFTELSLTHPQQTAPYAEHLIPLLKNKNNRTRWEAMHTIALVASLRTELIISLLPELEQMIERDGSIIVRDYAVEAIANFAGVNEVNAKTAFPILQRIAPLHDHRHIGRVLEGVLNCGEQSAGLRTEINKIAGSYCDHPKGVVNKTAKKIVKKFS